METNQVTQRFDFRTGKTEKIYIISNLNESVYLFNARCNVNFYINNVLLCYYGILEKGIRPNETCMLNFILYRQNYKRYVVCCTQFRALR